MKQKIIGQCKNCYHYCLWRDGKPKYVPKRKLFCQKEKDEDIIGSADNPDFGCWHWKGRNGREAVIVSTKRS